MKKPFATVVALFIFGLSSFEVCSEPPPWAGASPDAPDKASPGRASETYSNRPLSFEANLGYTDERVKFLSRSTDYTLFLTPTEAVLVFSKTIAEEVQMPKRVVHKENVTKHAVHMQLVGATATPQITGLDKLPGVSNYFVGSDPQKWRTGVPHYARVKYHQVYPGVDVIYYGSSHKLEYDFIVFPGADAKGIRLRFTGVDKLSLDDDGNLVLHTAIGDVIQEAPVIYQEVDNVKQMIPGGYILWGEGQVGFQIAAYDSRKPLVIDPAYSTYLGGSLDDKGLGIAVDASGNVYVTGGTDSDNLPAGQSTIGMPPAPLPVPENSTMGGDWEQSDAFVTKLDATGVLDYSTYLGGNNGDRGYGIAVNASGNTYVTGRTNSTDFPTTPNAYQPDIIPSPGWVGGRGDPTPIQRRDTFVVKLDATGALVYSTYLGGHDGDIGFGIAVDTSGNACVTGQTSSGQTNSLRFSVGLGPEVDLDSGAISADLQQAFTDNGFPLSQNATVLIMLSGSQWRITDEDQSTYDVRKNLRNNQLDVYEGRILIPFPITANAFQTGPGGTLDGDTLLGRAPETDDAFVTKLNADGTALVYSSYLGGGSAEWGYGITVDGLGNAYVTGKTDSTDFPTANALQPNITPAPPLEDQTSDAFAVKLDATGAAIYATYLGGSDGEAGYGIAADTAGNAYVTGKTTSTDFPTTGNALKLLNRDRDVDPNIGPLEGGADAFVAKLNPSGSAFVYATYLGGSGAEFGKGIAVDGGGNTYVTGWTGSTNFPTMNASQPAIAGAIDLGGEAEEADAFVAKLNPTGDALVYATYLGGDGGDFGYAIAIDTSGNAFVTGKTSSADFFTQSPFQSNKAGDVDTDDIFVTKFNADGTVPAELASFSGTVETRRGVSVQYTIHLRWRTYSEVNNLGFALLRREGTEKPFRQITFIEGSGSSPITHDYTFADTDVHSGRKYDYALEQVDVDGTRIRSGILTVTVLPRLDRVTKLTVPTHSRLLQNFPNPFNPDTWLPFQLALDAEVTIQIYDAKGSLVRTFDLGGLSAGYYNTRTSAVYWDGRSQTGERVSSGVYFYRLDANLFSEEKFTAVRKLTISK